MKFGFLSWTWFAVAVLFGIAAGADILGNGPQAYIGGLFTGAVYVLASRLMPKRDETSDDDDARRAPPADQDIPTSPATPRERLHGSADREKFPILERRKERQRSGRARSRTPERLSLLGQLRSFLRRFGK
jgi:hypothetical protein